MRTTLSIDDDVLAAARRIAADQHRSVGQVVSDLARRGLTPAIRVDTAPDGLPIVRTLGDHSITSDAVANALDDV